MSNLFSTIESLKAVRGNAVLLLNECNAAWHLKQGTVAVFAVRVKDHKPYGPRRYLFSCNQGDWLFNHESANEEFGFLAVGLEDSWLERIDLGRANQSPDFESVEFAVQIDAWVRRVESTMRLENAPHAEMAVASHAFAIAASECIQAPLDSVFWCMPLSGQIRLSGQVLESSMGWLPLCGEDFLIANKDSTARIEKSIHISSRTDLLTGLSRYHRIAFSQLSRQEQVELQRTAERLEERHRIQQLHTKEVLQELGSILLHKPQDAPTDDPLQAAMNLIGQQH